MYSERVAKKPMLVAANKIDMIDEDSPEYKRFKDYVEKKGYRVFPISAPINLGVQPLLSAAAEELQKAEQEPQEEEYEYFDFDSDDIDPNYREVYASKDGDFFVLSGKQLQ